MEGLTEVGLSPEHLVSILVLHVFATIIVGDGTPKGLGIGTELAGQGTSEASEVLAGSLTKCKCRLFAQRITARAPDFGGR